MPSLRSSGWGSPLNGRLERLFHKAKPSRFVKSTGFLLAFDSQGGTSRQDLGRCFDFSFRSQQSKAFSKEIFTYFVTCSLIDWLRSKVFDLQIKTS